MNKESEPTPQEKPQPMGTEFLVREVVHGEKSRAWVDLSAKIVFDGRFPSNTRCGTSQSAVPSAFTCSVQFSQTQIVESAPPETTQEPDELTARAQILSSCPWNVFRQSVVCGSQTFSSVSALALSTSFVSGIVTVLSTDSECPSKVFKH